MTGGINRYRKYKIVKWLCYSNLYGYVLIDYPESNQGELV